jgi:hypothetical protein
MAGHLKLEEPPEASPLWIVNAIAKRRVVEINGHNVKQEENVT